jgi:hypothetical protein
MKPLFIMADCVGRAVFPALSAELAYWIITRWPLHEVSPHESVEPLRPKNNWRHVRELKVFNCRQNPVNIHFTIHQTLLLCEFVRQQG